MEQQNNIAISNESAGVLPMDTGAVVNGVHDNGENNVTAKRGRGRPAKSADAKKSSKDTNLVKRARGRPSKTGETSTKLSSEKDQPSTNGDTGIKKRGRPSKGDVPNEQVNGISKPQVQENPVVVSEEQDDNSASVKKKRGRPSGSSSKKVVKVSKLSTSKESSSGKKRGRPSGSTGTKKVAKQSKTSAKTNGSGKTRGRPKKSAETSAATEPSTSEAVPVASNNAE